MNCNDITLRLAKVSEAEQIALMSHDLIEAGLGWAWTPARVARNIRCKDSVTLMAYDNQHRLLGFAMMFFSQEEAHLNLLAVWPKQRRLGIGSRLLKWLEKSALVAGIATIYLEVRASNHGARCFYRALGFQEIAYLPRYYNGREAAIRMARELRSSFSQSAL